MSIRHKIILGEQIYIVDKFDSIESNSIAKFVMLRKYDFEDMMTFDTDVYIIEEDIWNSYKDNQKGLIFPFTRTTALTKTTLFSNNISNYNNSFVYNYDDCTPIFDTNRDLVEIACDTIRIYSPSNKKNGFSNLIIYIDTYINSIHFHLLCKDLNRFTTLSENDFKIDGTSYNEYIEVTVPNLTDLFHKGYFNDNINTIDNWEDSSCVPLNLFKIPFKINKDEDTGEFTKDYIKEDDKLFCDDMSRFNNSYNVTLFPYSVYNKTTEVYDGIDNIESNTTTFTNDTKFKLKSSIEFINGTLSLVNTFETPNPDMTFKEAYQYYNGVTFDEYKGIYKDNESGEDTDELELADGSVIDGEVKMCGFYFTVASDQYFQNIIYSTSFWDNDAEDFSFELTGIFASWNQLPEHIYCRCKFIDQYLGNLFEGNVMVITKEHYKYMVYQQDKTDKTNRISLPYPKGIV